MKAVRVQVLAVYAVVFVLGHSAFGQADDAERLLADGDRLAWLKNWQAAEPFFEKAEVLFRERGDKRNELYARISRMRGQLPSRGLFETSTYLASVLDDPLTRDDARLRLRCLTVKGDVDLDFDTALAARDWTEVLSIAKQPRGRSMGQSREWRTRNHQLRSGRLSDRNRESHGRPVTGHEAE